MRSLEAASPARQGKSSSSALPRFYKVTDAPIDCQPQDTIFQDYDEAIRFWKKIADRMWKERKADVWDLSIRAIAFPEKEWAQIVCGMLPVRSGRKANG